MKKKKVLIITGAIILTIALTFIIINKISSNNNKKPKAEKMINAVERADKAVKDYINGDITYEDLGNKLKSAHEYCDEFLEKEEKAFDKDDPRSIYPSILCTSLWNAYYSASSDAIKEKYGLEKQYNYSYWEETRENWNQYKENFYD